MECATTGPSYTIPIEINGTGGVHDHIYNIIVNRQLGTNVLPGHHS